MDRSPVKEGFSRTGQKELLNYDLPGQQKQQQAPRRQNKEAKQGGEGRGGVYSFHLLPTDVSSVIFIITFNTF